MTVPGAARGESPPATRSTAGPPRRRGGQRGWRLALLTIAVSCALAWGGKAALRTALSATAAGPLMSGVYYGWTDGTRGSFNVLGSACPGGATDLAPVDALTTAWLLGPGLEAAFTPPAVDHAPVELGFASPRPAVAFAPAALADAFTHASASNAQSPVDVALVRLTVRCRSHAEASVRLGSAAVRRLPAGGSAPLHVEERRMPPASGLLGALVVVNDGDAVLTLLALDYAPSAAATGAIMAATGPRELLPGWLAEVLPAAPAAAPATPWQRAYRDPADGRGLTPRAAAALGLDIAPGDVALLVVPRSALRATLVPRPVLLYPVLTVATQAETVSVGLLTPLHGVTPTRP